MAGQQSRRLDLWHPRQTGETLADGVTATVTDDLETIRITVSRQVGADRGGAGSGGPLTVVAVDGEIDHDTASLLRLTLSQALDGRTPVCCELSRVTFFGAAAANVLLAANRQADAVGCSFSLDGVAGMTDRVLSIVDPEGVIAR